jgi:effector-binding domain-containing protein
MLLIQHMAVNKGDNVIIDIDRLVSSIEDMMPRDLSISSKCCIFKTPSILYRHNEKAYIPNAFSIGPLHHGSPNLKATEKIKAKYLQGLISRSYYPELLRTLIKSIMEVEKEARECYAEDNQLQPRRICENFGN